MPLNRRGFLTLAGTAVAGTALTACSTQSPTSTTSSTPAAAPSSAASSDAAPSWEAAKNTGSGQISLLTPDFGGDEGKTALEDGVLKPYFDGTDYTYNVDYTDWGNLQTKLATAITSTLPEVMMLGAGWVEPYAYEQVLGEIPESVYKDLGIPDNLFSQCRYEGKVYALPYVVDLRVNIARGDFLEEKGIKELPASLDELRELAKELTIPGKRLGIDLFTTRINQTWVQLMRAYGGQLFNEDGTKVAFDDGTGEAALQWILDVVKDGSADPAQKGVTGTPRPWQQGKAAIDFVNSSMWANFTSQTPDLITEDAMKFFVLPNSEAGKDPVMYMGGTLLALSAEPEFPEVSQGLLNWFEQPEPLVAALKVNGKAPAMPGVESDPELQKNRMMTFGVENMQYATAFDGGTAAWMDIRSELPKQIDNALAGNQTAKETIDAMVELCNAAMAKVA
ncbi:extracellular solute-binding protein [Tessaracoccus sp. OS52]|uniref:extracellular solute-binding protein n=1 Tax=Tessaracoccus sp. OS52 TaxID=2886691 RepID=UPI001D104850|nr:extracellular solute-binding protein [Tessaracoccus sp. OS52]MCC2593906.1 extracellular solute-binding protein [Tessaracoccus sp. OS52]